MLCHIAMTSFRLLDYDLCVENDPKTRQEKTAHKISDSKHGSSHHPTDQMVHAHSLHHGDNDSTKEKEGAPLAKK